ncbi:hypothetical protein AURDEDRAFT_75800, partial [Auricularia subglabra TFB-10046 SS5]
VSLLVSDALQAIGAIMDLRWIRLGEVTCGKYCNAQGTMVSPIQSLGETSVAMATMVIAVHTFLVIFFRWTPPSGFLIPIIVISMIWAYVSLYTGIAFAAHHAPGAELFTPTPYWCWISARYPKERFSAEYFWLWSAALLSILLYIPLFFVIRGNITVDPQHWWRIEFQRTTNLQRAGVTFSPSRQSLKMLLYPACYVVVVIPPTLTRWIGFSTENRIAPFWTFFSISIYGLSGVTNVLLLTLTRPSILSFGTSAVTRYSHTATGRGVVLSYPFLGRVRRSERRGIGSALDYSIPMERNTTDAEAARSHYEVDEDGQGTVHSPAESVKHQPIQPPSPTYSLESSRRGP